MSRIGPFGVPGTTAAVFSSARNIFWGGDDSRIKIIRTDAIFSSSLADAGNTPTTAIRPGLLLAQDSSSGKLLPWKPDATDGTQNLYAVNEHELVMVDAYGTAADRAAGVVVQAPLEAGSLLIGGSALVGHTDEYLARRLLSRMGCLLDDDPQNWKSGIVARTATKAADYAVLAGDNGTAFTAITGNVTFTLPTIKSGLSYEFLRGSDHNLVIASAAGDDVIVGNDLSADSITFSTSGNKIGARIRVSSVYLSGTLKWLPEVVAAPFSTGAFLTQTLAT
jgi:hypothetical protein